MIENPYPLKSFEDATRFIFVSIGAQKPVLKVVLFDQIEVNKWNLAFGDWSNNTVDDTANTNNNDVAKVLVAVAQAVFAFSDKYPERTIVIIPVDDKRKRLYNLVFKRRRAEIGETFAIIGIRGKQVEPYHPDEEYDSFELVRKNR